MTAPCAVCGASTMAALELTVTYSGPPVVDLLPRCEHLVPICGRCAYALAEDRTLEAKVEEEDHP